MTKYCPDCGCPLKETTLDRYWCPNCFKIIEEEKESDEDTIQSYIG